MPKELEGDGVNVGLSIPATMAILALMAISSLEPVKPQRKLHGIDPRIRRGQAGIGDVLVARAQSESAVFMSKELKSQGCVGEEVGVGVANGGDIVVAEQHPSTKFKIRHNFAVRSKVPL